MGPLLKIVSIIGDSLSMVRPPVGTTYTKTYPFLLQEKLGSEFHVVTRYRRANNSQVQSERQNMEDDILYNDSKYIVLHFGVADCVPRLMTRKERILLRLINVKAITDGYVKFKSNRRRFFTKHFPWTSVSKEKFRGNINFILDSIKSQCPGQKTIVVNIAETNEQNDFRSYGFKRHIQAYNEVLADCVRRHREFCVLMDIYEATRQNRNHILEDGTHLSFEGHRFMAERLAAIIKDFEK